MFSRVRASLSRPKLKETSPQKGNVGNVVETVESRNLTRRTRLIKLTRLVRWRCCPSGKPIQRRSPRGYRPV